MLLKMFQFRSKFVQCLDIIWRHIPHKLSSCAVTLATFAFGITCKEWVVVAIHLFRQFGFLPENIPSNSSFTSEEFTFENISLESLHLHGLFTMWIVCNLIGFLVYFSIGGFLHWHYYLKQKDKPNLWKCQPTKWLSAELERHEILFGSLSLLCVDTVTSVFATYIKNGGWSMVYYQFDEYTWMWYFLQWPVIFIYQDYVTYWLHRMYHTPWLYRKFHKAHHRYVQPTAFSVTAIHPVEIVHIQLTLALPLFTIPTHWTSFTCIGFYTYYHGIIDHSGIDFKAPWWQPWRPDTIFHDNHHQYFHVNFGFNCYYWDILHDTYRRRDRIYKEDIFYGRGKPIAEATSKEIEEEVKSRESENINAHRYINPILNTSELIEEDKRGGGKFTEAVIS
ncbi:uncharacterized protein LOC128990419 isoform X2 [Macrosteles quadrilineatus]|uniref:uncharacterized protein LOC128990419 isoform X2 n=1 Tax=Macrosteles quadrilineatus TaxID=74068 RepID=UPI0023E326F4|nr:uncharacterized protein LOC128990419 isoform X2 [Macrosteles quadrilineatus]